MTGVATQLLKENMPEKIMVMLGELNRMQKIDFLVKLKLLTFKDKSKNGAKYC